MQYELFLIFRYFRDCTTDKAMSDQSSHDSDHESDPEFKMTRETYPVAQKSEQPTLEVAEEETSEYGRDSDGSESIGSQETIPFTQDLESNSRSSTESVIIEVVDTDEDKSLLMSNILDMKKGGSIPVARKSEQPTLEVAEEEPSVLFKGRDSDGRESIGSQETIPFVQDLESNARSSTESVIIEVVDTDEDRSIFLGNLLEAETEVTNPVAQMSIQSKLVVTVETPSVSGKSEVTSKRRDSGEYSSDQSHESVSRPLLDLQEMTYGRFIKVERDVNGRATIVHLYQDDIKYLNKDEKKDLAEQFLKVSSYSFILFLLSI